MQNWALPRFARSGFPPFRYRYIPTLWWFRYAMLLNHHRFGTPIGAATIPSALVFWRIMNIEAVIFDFDGTLYDMKGFAKKLILSSLRDIFIMGAERKIRRELRGKDFGNAEALKNEMISKIAEKSRKSEQKIRTWYENRYVQNMCRVLSKHYRVRSEVPELFASLHEKEIKIAIFSDYPIVRERMSAIGLGKEAQNLCEKIYSAQDFGALKPAPRPFLEIAAALNTKSENCLVVGDRCDTDGEGARLSGMSFFQIKNDKDFQSLFTIGFQPF